MTYLPVEPLPDDIVASKTIYRPDRAFNTPYVPLASAFAAGMDTPRDFLERALAAFDSREPSVRAFVVIDKERARAKADAASLRWASGTQLSPVDGMPVGVKDMIETSDFPTQMNSPIYKDWQSHRDAACVWALKQAGAYVLGKTVTTEFACGNSGPTRNPYDSERTPGGSSSGSAASVGAGMVPLALGTQTQASTLRPASFCGAYALKPSHGAVNVGGITPLSPTQDHLGVIGASLEDVWSSSVVMARRAGGTPPHAGISGPEHLPDAVMPRSLVRLDMHGCQETDSISQQAFEGAIERMAAQGVRIIDRHNDPEIEALEAEIIAASEYSYDIFSWEAPWPLGSYFDHGPQMVGKRIHELLTHTSKMTPDDYQRAFQQREVFRTKVDRIRAKADAFVSPASSGPAIINHDYTGSRSYPTPWTLVAGPAFALPLMSAEDLPFGLQLAGYCDSDTQTCAIARWVRDLLLSN